MSKKFRAIHQIVPHLAYGDAVGNQVRELRRLLLGWGYASEIFVETFDPRVAKECRSYKDYLAISHPDNLLILHYCTGGDSNLFTLTLPDQVVLYYHNLTPAHFFYRVNGAFASQLQETRNNLSRFRERLPALAASPYNAQELQSLGFKVLAQAPYILELERLDEGLDTESARRLAHQLSAPESVRTWLYVGRLAPNKRIEDILNAFYYYHHWIEPQSRLLLVGSGQGLDLYVDELRTQVRQLELTAAVVFPGHFGPADGLGVFYRQADLYLCMSEHEGFCIPLVEAMHYNLPVLAYNSTGVPFTLGSSGVLIQQKKPAWIAEMAHAMIANSDFRDCLLAGHQKRLLDFNPIGAREQIHNCIELLEAQER